MTSGEASTTEALAAVRAAVAEVLEIETVAAGALLRDDLGADSLDLLCIRMELEERLDILITDEAFSIVETVTDLASVTERLTAVRAA